MHGGMSVYRGAPAAARRYLEADRSRADDYYLTEGTGIADRYVASPTEGVGRAGVLSGDAYEAWVAGYDPATGTPKGRLRSDDQAVRFVEVTVNGPKSWSLAAAIHADISSAYDAAQDRAAEQIIEWLAQHSTTRVGPRGAQVQVPVTELEAVTVRHYTSRAGDPHRHLHLQVNARVRAEDHWYGLHTVGVRDSLDAVNGIGHAAMMTDPAFRAALADHGYTLDPGGEITQMREHVGAFSARAQQIKVNLDRYEAAWRRANPDQEPGPWLRQRWDHQAWGDARPGKIAPRDGAEITAHWVTELHALGYRHPTGPVLDTSIRPGQLDRTTAVDTVLARLGKRRSAWNPADVRGEVEQLLARAGMVDDAAVRVELAEDLTERIVADCVLLLDRPGLPEHLRTLTSRHVLDVEADLITRLIDRVETIPAAPGASPELPAEMFDGLDVGQRQVIAAVAGEAPLVVVEGAAGAGKTTTLAAARSAIEADGHRLLVVTPTRKAAQVATRQLDTRAFSAAWLAHQHGWRWDADGHWTHLTPGQIESADRGRHHRYLGPRPDAELQPGDVLLVDEAGMLDQDTARALLHVADERQARLVLVGDRHQLPAVGRGGVLDLAARYTPPQAHVELTTVHRFTDSDYATLSLAMRTGTDPDRVFDTLAEKGLVRVYPTEIERTDALADDTATALRDGQRVRVLVDTNDQAAQLNTAIRDRLVATRHVDDSRTVTTRAGQQLGAGDLVVTRRNDPTLDVANRETWTVTHISGDGDLVVTGERGHRPLPAQYARQQVELGYAATVHTAQGDTTGAAHLVLGEHTGAASAYVAMTRGRDTNTVHIVADTLEEARQLWVETFSRDRADLGPAVAAQRAAVEAARYAPHRPLEEALADLRAAWTVEADTHTRLTRTLAERDQLRGFLALKADTNAALAPVAAARQQAHHAAARARQHADRVGDLLDTISTKYATQLTQQWDELRPAVRDTARTVLDGPGRFGLHRRAVHEAQHELAQWADNWRAVVPHLPTQPTQLAYTAAHDYTDRDYAAIRSYARNATEQTHPEHHAALEAAKTAAQQAHRADAAYRHAVNNAHEQWLGYGSLAYAPDVEARLARTERDAAGLSAQHDAVRQQVTTLLREPALRSQPPERLHTEHDTWHRDHRTTQRAAPKQRATHTAAHSTPAEPSPVRRPERGYTPPGPSQPGRGSSR
jgi:exodeoxyribonuclease V alpha subunit